MLERLHEFVKESNRIEGIGRAPKQQEIEAHSMLVGLPSLSVATLEQFVSMVQPDAFLRRRVGVDVRVGDHVAPPGGPEIETQLTGLLERAVVCSGQQPYEIHQWYETLHPFTDGNGRSGRALWLWMMGRRGELDRALGLGFLHSWYYQSLSAAR